MFKCEDCKRVVGPSITEIRVPVSQRKKTYQPREYKVRRNHFVDRGGKGQEIVREKVICPFCASLAVHGEIVPEIKKLFLHDKKRVMIKEIVIEPEEKQE